ncbi:GNAT family N-acetyltransferase [Methylonatrum kenyense]|uniref:GNAT family N-acetyltransferase n=1 Tax=Methylonatrum kenyense TaxID=455253 RepID=UPI0020BE5D7D|nr:GNAT family N-acyltransferase [Methylonatrum kenyense]MCK8515772.1 GNAT family N-acetyltransferase [Methylonatrum kenyense]
MNTLNHVPTIDRTEGCLCAGLARSPAEIDASQALRFRVFATEMGANLHTLRAERDVDAFDAYCRHLVVQDCVERRVVACTRILEGWQATRAGGFYAAGEFRMDAINALPGRKLEIGRTCVDPDYRSGPALALLWAALADFVRHHRYDYLIGCASISVRDHGARAAAIMHQLRNRHMTPEPLRVSPRLPLPESDFDPTTPVELPSLIRTYLALGARVCGEPCLDPDFRVADLFLLLDLRQLELRPARRFLHSAGGHPVAA